MEHARFDNVRGISAAEQAELRRRAARWHYAFLTTAESMLRTGRVAALLLAPLFALGLGVRLRRQATPRSQQVLATSAVCLNGIALLGLLSPFIFGLFGSPVAQFNLGNPAGMEAWSLWVRFWPVLLRGFWLGLGVAVIVFAATLIKTLVDPSNWWRTALCWALTALHLGLAFDFVASCFPTA